MLYPPGAHSGVSWPLIANADMIHLHRNLSRHVQSPKTNLCPTIRGTQGQGVMPDGTSRFTTMDGKPLYHFMGVWG